MIVKPASIKIDSISSPLFKEKEIELLVARLDLIHPIVSGNKLFKLHYFIEAAKSAKKSTIVTLGGAYSNHLAATAYHCRSVGLKSIGLVRGELPAKISYTLLTCEDNGMQLIFLDRKEYPFINEDWIAKLLNTSPSQFAFIPEGGYHPLGADGASMIMTELNELNATHICTAVGTATTLAGIISSSNDDTKIIGVPVLKGMTDIEKRISFLLNNKPYNKPLILNEYHFGGYAKKSETLIQFMNDFYKDYSIPTDFVYTGKMMFAIIEKIKTDYFPQRSRILCLHTGGLQGNASLPEHTLVF
jgi:1-aminocyclopropane-1-carboxylate deaminase